MQQITVNCPSISWVDIPVSGLGNLGANNLGIDGVGVEMAQSAGFVCSIYLKAPNDSIYLLASGEEGFNSFPDYADGLLNVEFKGCANLPYSSANVNQPSGKSFLPFDDFTELNELGINPNGTWQIGFCGLPDDIDVSCVNLTFNSLCPEVVSVNVTDLSCDNANDGIIELIVDGGSCIPTYYSLNEGPTTSTPHWENLTTGLFNIHISNYLTAERSSNLTVCDQDIQVTVSVNDLTPPSIQCTPDLTVYIPDTIASLICQSGWYVDYHNPLFNDNCSIHSVSAVYFKQDTIPVETLYLSTDQSGQVEQDKFFPTGINRLHYTIDDGVHSTECETRITIIDTIKPFWPVDLDTLITLECKGEGNEVYNGLQDWFYSRPVLCSNEVGEFAILSTDTLCGASFRQRVAVFLHDLSNNYAETKYVTIQILDTEPPVFSGMIPDVTILCDQPMPELPAITAFDSCAGNVNDRISLASSIQQIDCSAGGIAQVVQYSWEVSDDCGNTTSYNWTVTVMNNFTIDLGPEVSICAGDTAFLNAGNGHTFAWGNGASTSILPVTAPGMYVVTVTSFNGCCAVDSVRVKVNANPSVSATVAPITCLQPSTTLRGASSISGSTFSWTGPGNFSSNIASPVTALVGTYQLRVTSPPGCSSSTELTVNIDTLSPAFELMDDTLTCSKDSLRLFVSPVVSDYTYAWSGPDNFQSGALNPVTKTPGTYTLTVTAPNGCTTMGSLAIEADQAPPAFELMDDTLTCSKDS
ncbi:MAG: hypothetical protein KDC57_24025, partial [Saprospiraceae bacterium]|nr:hypothetical protein [Saprospiraceae bacterium]